MVEGRTELGVAVVQHVTTLAQCSGHVVNGIASHLSDPSLRGVAGDAGKDDAPGLQMNKEKDVKKSLPASTAMCAERKSFHVAVCLRFGTGGIPWRRSMLPTVWPEM